jgi:acetyl-CoA carboxylase carboxyltransferase component
MEFPMPWEVQAGGSSKRKKRRKKKNKKGTSEEEDGIANPLLDADSLFDDGGIDLEDETLDVEGAMDDLESALEASDSTGPKWHKTTYVILDWSCCVC